MRSYKMKKKIQYLAFSLKQSQWMSELWEAEFLHVSDKYEIE